MISGSGSSPPGGNGPRKFGPNMPPGANDGGDGSSKENATWVAGTPDEFKKGRHFIVNRMGTWVRCSLDDALMDSDTGYPVYASWSGQRVRFQWNGPGRVQYQAFAHQFWQVTQEEEDRIARHEPLASENLAEAAEQEYDAAGDAVFDPVEQMPSTPPTNPHDHSDVSLGGRPQTSNPTLRGPSSDSQPQSGGSGPTSDPSTPQAARDDGL